MTAEQLRNSILQEAISGRLVPQDPNDEPASILLQHIREEKARLVKAKQISKRDFEVLPITEDDVDFDIPVTWEWVRLGDIFKHSTGKALNEANKKGCLHDYITTSNVYWGYFKLDKLRQMYYTEDEKEKCMATKGDLLVLEGGDVGRAAIWDKDYDIFLQNHIHKLRAYIPVCTKFYYYCLYLFHDMGLVGGKGIGIQGLSSGALHQIIFPLPPLAEQKRIVAKLEELLPIVEQYGKAQKELDELNAALPARLRQSILQEAIHGKLVPQDEKEGTAEELLKLIDAEKQRLVKERILKKAIRTSAIIPEDSPFEIPTSWLWANLEDVTYAVGGRENQILSKEILKEGKIRVVSQGQAIYDGYCNDATKEINDLPVILFGDHTRNVKYIDFTFVIGADGTKLFRPIGIYPRYMYYWMKYAASTLRNRGYARHYTLLKVVPIPLPPLAEQQRIVAKIEELFAEIDKLTK